jgi:serine/threonine protein kinase
MSGREVAVKFLRKALVAEPRALEQFLREARLVANLKHPGIVGIEGLGRTPGGGLFLVMELVEGNNLETIGASGGVTPGQAVAWIATAAQAVHFAHEQGVIHCDLKPANLLLDNAGLVRVTDFGLAVHPVTEPRTNLLAGTPAFMAPEQVDACWGQISPRTDVYGLGAVLYFLLFGRPPHAGKGMADVLAHVVCGKPVPLPETPLVSPQLAAVLMRMLAKPPAERFVSAAEVAEALMNALPAIANKLAMDEAEIVPLV